MLVTSSSSSASSFLSSTVSSSWPAASVVTSLILLQHKCNFRIIPTWLWNGKSISALDIPMYQPHLFVPAPVSYDGTFSSSPDAWGISAVLYFDGLCGIITISKIHCFLQKITWYCVECAELFAKGLKNVKCFNLFAIDLENCSCKPMQWHGEVDCNKIQRIGFLI